MPLRQMTLLALALAPLAAQADELTYDEPAAPAARLCEAPGSLQADMLPAHGAVSVSLDARVLARLGGGWLPVESWEEDGLAEEQASLIVTANGQEVPGTLERVLQQDHDGAAVVLRWMPTESLMPHTTYTARLLSGIDVVESHEFTTGAEDQAPGARPQPEAHGLSLWNANAGPMECSVFRQSASVELEIHPADTFEPGQALHVVGVTDGRSSRPLATVFPEDVPGGLSAVIWRMDVVHAESAARQEDYSELCYALAVESADGTLTRGEVQCVWPNDWYDHDEVRCGFAGCSSLGAGTVGWLGLGLGLLGLRRRRET